ncbi:MAG: hypothetical protein BWY65_01968 [Firmicutes bacterium ADurb.Bin373]|nr:MAG: hypothetical protein BWY65_01968 [Firmicutes bacterium ADurb.Bin373]
MIPTGLSGKSSRLFKSVDLPELKGPRTATRGLKTCPVSSLKASRLLMN